MSIIGIEEIFLDVEDLARAVNFYEGVLGLPVAMRNDERAYLQCERSHVVLQVKGHGGRHRGGGPMHFSFTVTEDVFDGVAERAAAANIFTPRPHGRAGQRTSVVHARPRRQRDRGEYALPLRRTEALSLGGRRGSARK